MDGEDTLKILATPMQKILASRGITMDSLAQELSEELEALETKIIKVKRGEFDVHKPDNPNKYHEICTTNEEMVIAVELTNWSVRQAARMDAQKLWDLYPVDKHDVNLLGGVTLHVIYDQGKKDAE